MKSMHPEIVAFWEQQGERIVFDIYPDNSNSFWRICHHSYLPIAHQYMDYPIRYRLLPDYTWISEEKMLRLIKLKAFL